MPYCQKLGRIKKFCTIPQRRAQCGQAGHEGHEYEIKCANCERDNSAYTWSCPKLKTDQEIIKNIKTTHPEAMKRVEVPEMPLYPNHINGPAISNFQIVSNLMKNRYHMLSISLVKWLDAIKAQNSSQNDTISNSFTALLNEITLPMPALNRVINRACRYGFIIIRSLWNFTGVSTAMLWRCISNFRMMILF